MAYKTAWRLVWLHYPRLRGDVGDMGLRDGKANAGILRGGHFLIAILAL